MTINRKKIFGDMVLNIVAAIIPVAVLQLWILPKLAINLGDETYGLMITLVALFNVVPAMLGNVLNNVRLLHSEVVNDKKNSGDFNLLLIIFSIINLIIVFLFSYYYENGISATSLILNIIVSVLWLLREYYIVAFRIKINYVAILICNIIMILGYIIGFLLSTLVGSWQWVYILGYAFSLIFICVKSNMWKERPGKTPIFREIANESTLLVIAGLFSRVIIYADKLLLYPMLGGVMVAIYYASTIFGKIVSMGVTPVSGVILSYLSKSQKKNDETFNVTLLITGVVCICGFFICVAISRPILTLLYPQYVEEAMKYIWLTTANAVTGALISVVNPFVLKFFPMKWQVWTNLANAVIYVLLCLLLLNFWGLMGFCIGALVATVIKLLFLLFVYYRVKEKSDE